MRESDVIQIPTEEGIRRLPRWAQVAFAARCARRVQPLFAALDPGAPPEHIEGLARSIAISERAAADADAGIAAHAAARAAALELARTIANAAEARASTARGAARAALITARTATRAAADAADAADAAARAATHITSRAAAHAAAVAAFYLAGDEVVNAVNAAVQRDFEQLVAAASKSPAWNDGTPVPPESFGPMWPRGEPRGWPFVVGPEAPRRATGPQLRDRRHRRGG